MPKALSKFEASHVVFPENFSTLFFYKNNFIRTKALILGKKYEQGKNKARLSVPQNIRAVSRLAILKIIRTKRQNKAWLSLILYCM